MRVSHFYNAPKARLRYAGHQSDLFLILGGMGQGCLLSPLLLDLAIEPLVISIRQNGYPWTVGGTQGIQTELIRGQHSLGCYYWQSAPTKFATCTGYFWESF